MDSMAVQPGFRAVPGWRSWKLVVPDGGGWGVDWARSSLAAGVRSGWLRWIESASYRIQQDAGHVSEDRYLVNWSVLVPAPRSPGLEKGLGGVVDDGDGMGRSLIRQIGVVGVLSRARILGFSNSGKTPSGSRHLYAVLPPVVPDPEDVAGGRCRVTGKEATLSGWSRCSR